MHIMLELKMLKEVYGVKEIAFEDDNLSLNPQRLVQLCKEMVHQNLQLKWSTPNGVHINTLDETTLEWMKRSGCKRLNFGIESGDEGILKIMNKQLDLKKTKEIVKIAHDKGIVTLGYFVLGVPGESGITLRNTIDYAKSLDLDEIGLFIATPFPQTQLEKDCREKGYLISDYRDIVAEDDIENQVFIETALISKESLLHLKDVFFQEFYKHKIKVNPWYYCKRVLRHPTLVRKLWKG